MIEGQLATTASADLAHKVDPNVSTHTILGECNLEQLGELLQQDEVIGNSLGFSIKDLNVHGRIPASNYIHTVATAPLQFYEYIRSAFRASHHGEINILRDFDLLLRSGEMLAVLGRPGSGCTTLLKVISGELDGLRLKDPFSINYEGAHFTDIQGEFRSKCIYMAELDVHFPELTVGETLDFAARTQHSETGYSGRVKDALVAIFNLSGVLLTMVGNEVIRGISGGEKKRLSIVEALVGLPSIQCWDNSTRGMDSATALRIIRTFRQVASYRRATIAVSLYQASQDALDVFGKTVVLYKGRQIFFGTWADGLNYFQSLGFHRPNQMTTGDFFTALTNPEEAKYLVLGGSEKSVPVTADDFALRWRGSAERAKLIKEIEAYDRECAPRASILAQIRKSRISDRRPSM